MIRVAIFVSGRFYRVSHFKNEETLRRYKFLITKGKLKDQRITIEILKY